VSLAFELPTPAEGGRVARLLMAEREAMEFMRPMAEGQAPVQRRLKRPACFAQQRL
jgi:hypothetical protein